MINSRTFPLQGTSVDKDKGIIEYRMTWFHSKDSYCTTNDTGTQWNNSVFLWKKYRLRVQYTCTVHISILNVKYLHADFREFLKVPTVPLSS